MRKEVKKYRDYSNCQKRQEIQKKTIAAWILNLGTDELKPICLLFTKGKVLVKIVMSSVDQFGSHRERKIFKTTHWNDDSRSVCSVLFDVVLPSKTFSNPKLRHPLEGDLCVVKKLENPIRSASKVVADIIFCSIDVWSYGTPIQTLVQVPGSKASRQVNQSSRV